MKKLEILVVILSASVLLFSGCGDKAKTVETAKPALKDVAEKQKATTPRKKVSDKEAVELLLAQYREAFEIAGFTKSKINEKMLDLEVAVRDRENNVTEAVRQLRKALKSDSFEPCVSENNELIHIKTEYEKVVLKYAETRGLRHLDRSEMVFAFRSLPKDEQRESAEKLAKLMK